MAISINGSTGITDVNGTAAAPAITGTDTDSGMYFGTNTVSLATGGTAAVTVDSSQNVAITGTATATKLIPTGTSATGNGMYLPATNALGFSTAGAEAVRIDSSGNLLVGTTTAGFSSQTGVSVNNPTAATYLAVSHINGATSGGAYIGFVYNAGTIGSVTQNGTTGVLYNITSDYRLKNNPQALTGAKDFVMALQPKKWQWWDGSGEGVGFIAHEFMEVAKYSGQGEKDALDAEGKPVMQSIQPSSSEVMANLVSFIQEQQALITSLTDRIAALEAR